MKLKVSEWCAAYEVLDSFTRPGSIYQPGARAGYYFNRWHDKIRGVWEAAEKSKAELFKTLGEPLMDSIKRKIETAIGDEKIALERQLEKVNEAQYIIKEENIESFKKEMEAILDGEEDLDVNPLELDAFERAMMIIDNDDKTGKKFVPATWPMSFIHALEPLIKE